MSSAPDRASRRFLVTWRDGLEPPGIHAVGCLEADGEAFHFRYLPDAAAVPGFRPLPGFGQFDREYVSATLFFFFAERLMSRRRPEFSEYLAALDLPPEASDLDLLGRSEAVVKGDRVAVVEEPAVAGDGRTSHVFVVRGLRFALPDQAEREVLLASLDAGTPLTVQDDEANPVNRSALRLLEPGGRPVGWVPDGLIPYVRALKNTGGRIVVQRRNSAAMPPHLRLLARAAGRLPADVPPLPQLQAEAVRPR